MLFLFFFLNDPATTEIYTLSLHDALPIWVSHALFLGPLWLRSVQERTQILGRHLPERGNRRPENWARRLPSHGEWPADAYRHVDCYVPVSKGCLLGSHGNLGPQAARSGYPHRKIGRAHV